MKPGIKHIFILLTGIASCYATAAQDTTRVTGTQYVSKGQTLNLSAGSVLIFEPGATLQVDGSIKVNGTPDKPVYIISVNPTDPGVGILISGIEEEGSINFTNAHFQSLLQPLHFDPFWYRKEVNITHTSISASHSGEPILFVAKPLLDIRGGKDIHFRLKNMRVFNNSGNMLLEAVGADGIVYELDGLYFFENNIEGGSATLGMLHLDCNLPVNADKVQVGNLAFVRNFAGSNSIGLSVGGGKDNIAVNEFYQDNAERRLIYDREVNSRIPKVDVKQIRDISEWATDKDQIRGISHRHGEVGLKVSGHPRIKELRDSLNEPVIATLTHRNDSTILSYTDGDPKFLVTWAGYIVRIPPAPPEVKPEMPEEPKPVPPKIDTVAKDSSLISFRFRFPTFGGKNKVITKLHTWEIGTWFGGGIYCGGDYKHRFGPFIPSTIEYSYGAYGQYNINDRFAVRSTFYITTISMHNPWAPGQFARMADVFSYNRKYQTIEVGHSFNHMFATKMQIFEIGGEWFIRSYMLEEKQKSKLVPAIGFGVGIFHFTPYRYAWDPRGLYETYDDWKKRIQDNYYVNLRLLGTEGQNFLPGEKPYSTVAFSANCSFSLNILFRNWAIKGESKFVVTSTDYLDDYGPGLWYGGDYNKLIESAKSLNLYSDKLLSKVLRNDPNIAPNAPRSTNGLPDAYFQLHAGISYFFNRPNRKKL